MAARPFNFFGAEHRLGFTKLTQLIDKLKTLKAQLFTRAEYDGAMKKIHDGTKYLLNQFGFPEFSSVPAKNTTDGNYQYRIINSPQFPNAYILRIRKLSTPSYIHDVAYIKFPNRVVEYYNPTVGRTHYDLPEEIKTFITEDDKYKFKEYEEDIGHQSNDQICTRHALMRDYYSELSNPEYHKVITGLQRANNLESPADVIWNMTQNTLASKQQNDYVFKGGFRGRFSEQDYHILPKK
jgi:hypothetical protein